VKDRLPPLLPGEFAWACDVLKLEANDRVRGWAGMSDRSRLALEANAARLYLEVVMDDAGALLIHRGGWPFDLRTFDGDPIGRTSAELRPTGAGDEVMRDLITSFEAAVPSRTLHIHAADHP
jgi:hypothetical protein